MARRKASGPQVLVWGYIAAMSLILLGTFLMPAQAQGIPPGAAAHRAEMLRSAWRTFGPSAPTALLAAQIHAESTWRTDATSRVGAQGLAQFMPRTAAEMAERYPADCAPANPNSARWAIACRDRYMQRLLQSQRPFSAALLSECSRWVFALRAYNGGNTWVIRDRRAAAAGAADPDEWMQVQGFNAGRSEANHRENTRYAPKILALQARYQRAGWGRALRCENG